MNVSSVLLIEDSIAAEPCLQRVAREIGDVIRARSILEALAQCGKFVPDIVICDWRIADGYAPDAVRELREHGVEAPVIVVGKEASLDQIIATIRNGAFDYLRRPFKVERLKESVAAAGEFFREAKAQSSEGAFARAETLPVRVGMTWRQIEQIAIAQTLSHCNGSVPEAARVLGLSASTIYRKLEQIR